MSPVSPVSRRSALFPGVLVLLSALTVAGCSASSGDGRFDAQSASPSPTCRVHQKAEPGRRYTGGSQADTGAVLEMMRYYTAHGTKRFCDGRGPTDTDRDWTDLYARLGGKKARVTAG
ncbi:hypothetical protein AB0J21_15570 [Streptomyces sp. NPDC049954]|uniref:hypothetical protein n=1 Tax=Streptomyces sp. NPDC049954 TaxID=3155779 RepID=UPI003449B4EB